MILLVKRHKKINGSVTGQAEEVYAHFRLTESCINTCANINIARPCTLKLFILIF